MIKDFIKNDNICVRLLFINLLLIALPLLVSSENLRENLEKFNKQLFYRLIETHPGQNVIATSFSLVTLLILLRMSSTDDVSREIEKTFSLSRETNNLIIYDFLNLLNKYEHEHLFIMTNIITIINAEHRGENLTLSAKDTIDSWSSYDLCHRSGELSIPDTETILNLFTETHFKNELLYYFVDTVVKGPFYASEYETINADIIYMEAQLKYGEIPDLLMKVLEIPYADGTTSLLIMLPFKNDGIHKLEQDLQAYNLAAIESYLQLEYVRVTIPKFISTVNFSLKNVLEYFGMKSMFDRSCYFSGRIRVSDVNYKATFLMNENSARNLPLFGVNASAIPQFQYFDVDHPFLYMIKSNKNLIYLMGKFLK